MAVATATFGGMVLARYWYLAAVVLMGIRRGFGAQGEARRRRNTGRISRRSNEAMCVEDRRRPVEIAVARY